MLQEHIRLVPQVVGDVVLMGFFKSLEDSSEHLGEQLVDVPLRKNLKESVEVDKMVAKARVHQYRPST